MGFKEYFNDGKNEIKVISKNKIWSNDLHNAFTTLIEFNGNLYCAFREGTSHGSRDGVIKIIRSRDGDSWQLFGELSVDENDLRDPKLAIINNHLFLYAFSRYKENVKSRHKTYSWMLKKDNWSGPFSNDSDQDTWKWGISKINDKLYSVAYSGKDSKGTIYKSEDGRTWEIIKSNFFPNLKDYPNETALLEFDNGKMLALIRTDKGSKDAIMGVAEPPYKNWDWKIINKRIGGPALIQLPNDQIIAVVRLYNERRTSICELNIRDGSLKEIITLSVGGDTGYAGMALWEGYLYISYYSDYKSDKGNSDIYLAKIKY